MKRNALFVLLLCLSGLSASCFARQKYDRAEVALRYVRKGTPPFEYIADKLRNYKVVAIGEDHWIADHSEFLCAVLRNVGYTEDTRIANLAIEFGNEGDQKLADSLALGKEWNETLARKILLGAPDVFGNPYKGYRDVLYTVWETNTQKPDALKTRILLLDPADTPRTPEARDENMTRILRNCIRSGRKTIFYAGQAHTQFQVRGQLPPSGRGYYYNYPSAAKSVKISYPNDIFSINLWGGFMGSHGYLPHAETVWTLIDGGDIDRAFELNGNTAVGFDIDASFPLTPSQLFAGKNSGRDPWAENPDNGAPYTASLTMSDYCDGFIFVKPVKEFRGMQLIDIYDDAYIAALAERPNVRARTKEEIFETIIKWRPTCLPLTDR